MAMKQTGRKVYRSMQGKTVDMDLLRQRNELTPAVGNVKVNARGDELGPGGQIVKKREEVLGQYYKNNTPDEIAVKKSKPQETEASVDHNGKDVTDDWVEPVAEDGWVEDDDGNFVQKGE
jgi:hypothetical protein